MHRSYLPISNRKYCKTKITIEDKLMQYLGHSKKCR